MHNSERDPNASGVREVAMFAMAWATRAQRAEIASLNLDDFQVNEGAQGTPEGAKMVIYGSRESGTRYAMCIFITALSLP
jgi:hypothetical protein